MNRRLPGFLTTNPKLRLASLIGFTLLALVILVSLLMTQPSNTTNPHPNSQGSSSNGSQTPTPPGLAVIEITHTGFLPKTLTIQPNTQVVWVNEDRMPHLPAADPYPSHRDLPSLVAPRALGQHETYSFLFTKAETVSYHDDVRPMWTGRVVVRGE